VVWPINYLDFGGGGLFWVGVVFFTSKLKKISFRVSIIFIRLKLRIIKSLFKSVLIKMTFGTVQTAKMFRKWVTDKIMKYFINRWS
jgi:hypothetical protein